MIPKDLEYILGQYKTAQGITILENLVVLFLIKLQEMIDTRQIDTKQLEDILDYEKQLYSQELNRIYEINRKRRNEE